MTNFYNFNPANPTADPVNMRRIVVFDYFGVRANNCERGNCGGVDVKVYRERVLLPADLLFESKLYWGHLNAVEAEAILKDFPVRSLICRKTFDEGNLLQISMKTESGIVHVPIVYWNSGWSINISLPNFHYIGSFTQPYLTSLVADILFYWNFYQRTEAVTKSLNSPQLTLQDKVLMYYLQNYTYRQILENVNIPPLLKKYILQHHYNEPTAIWRRQCRSNDDAKSDATDHM